MMMAMLGVLATGSTYGRHPDQHPGDALDGPREGVVHRRLDHQEDGQRREVRPAVRIGREGGQPGRPGGDRRLRGQEHLIAGDEPWPDHPWPHRLGAWTYQAGCATGWAGLPHQRVRPARIRGAVAASPAAAQAM